MNDHKLEIDTRFSELETIFAGNRQGFIPYRDKPTIRSDEFEKLVCVKDNEAVGFLVAYERPDFLAKEGFAVDFQPAKNCVYIWDVITRKDFQGRGVATFLIDCLVARFLGKDIYSVVDARNVISFSLHEEAGFKSVLRFEHNLCGENETFDLLKLKNEKRSS